MANFKATSFFDVVEVNDLKVKNYPNFDNGSKLDPLKSFNYWLFMILRCSIRVLAYLRCQD